MLQCKGCGSTESIAEIRRKHPDAIACCPEREMVEVGWQSIGTAPKDGTHILWCGDAGTQCVIWWPVYKECFEDGYWMPLPAPPLTAA